ncbi:MAG: PTS sugar transporter subunit IIA [Planctomycetales bacterium]|nr:PTS sugar transporter subunit IIA [Planctomycetales bacterium]
MSKLSNSPQKTPLSHAVRSASLDIRPGQTDNDESISIASHTRHNGAPSRCRRSLRSSVRVLRTPQTARRGLFPVADDDFDVASLAAYLHMMPAQISKLAERGKIPARRVAGDWVFSRPEVTQWLEDRMGLSDDDELAAMETQLIRQEDVDQHDVSLARILSLDTVAVPLQARTRGKVISTMCNLASTTGLLWDADKMAEAVTAREALHPTALDNGAALLHPRRPQSSILAEAVLALGITSQGIPFGNRGQLTDIFFLICATSDHEHLRILARLSRLLTDSEWLAKLRHAPDAVAAYRLILDRDAELGEAGQA